MTAGAGLWLVVHACMPQQASMPDVIWGDTDTAVFTSVFRALADLFLFGEPALDIRSLGGEPIVGQRRARASDAYRGVALVALACWHCGQMLLPATFPVQAQRAARPCAWLATFNDWGPWNMPKQ